MLGACGQVLAEMDPDDILAKQVEQLEKEKRELQEKLKAQEKKVTVKNASFCFVYQITIITNGFYVHLFICCCLCFSQPVICLGEFFYSMSWK